LAYKQKRNNKLQNNENAMESGKQNNSEHREEKCTRVREKESDFDGSSGECHGEYRIASSIFSGSFGTIACPMLLLSFWLLLCMH
jgi:hypothetical protein